MPEIIKTYRQRVPALRFIGKKYGAEDQSPEGGFGQLWGEWFARGYFQTLEAALPGSLQETYEDADAYLGLMRWKENEPCQYWIGMFFPEGSPVPEGFASVDFAPATLGVCWLYGPEAELYAAEGLCTERLVQEGMELCPDEDGAFWSLECYGCPRFTTPDEKGNVILDIVHYVR